MSTPSARLRPIEDADFEELMRLAKKDDHANVPFPTHVIVRTDEIAGGVSIGGTCFVSPFLSTKMLGRDVKAAIADMHRVAREAGYEDALVSMGRESPMYKYRKRLGFMELGESLLHYIVVK
jgi:arginine/ornithine N-succinyltransferase beta subunit